MVKGKKSQIQKDISDALRRFPKVVKMQERRALAERRFLKKTFGPLVKQLNKLKKVT